MSKVNVLVGLGRSAWLAALADQTFPGRKFTVVFQALRAAEES
jgi:hypothetical protein